MRVLHGGPVYSLAVAGRAEAIAYDGERIVAVGPTAAVRAAAGPGAELVDLAGRVVVPGFVDAHHHLGVAALYRGAVDCGPEAVADLPAMHAALADAARALPAGRWVLGFGYDDWRLGEGRAPTRAELDAACPEHPAVVMHFSFHQGVANSRALELAGIGRTSRDPPGGQIERGRRGEPTGRLYEMAVAGVERLAAADLLARDAGGFVARLERYQAELFAAGITRVADPTVTRDLERLYRAAHASGRLRLPVIMMPVSERGYLAHPDDVLADATGERLDGPPSGEGSDALRVGPLKLFLDGGDNCAVCISVAQGLRAALASAARVARARSLAAALLPIRFARRTHVRLGRDLHVHTGLRYYPDDAEATRVARRATERGFALALHAMGNEAVAQALRIIGAAGGRPRGGHRIEHAMVLDVADARRIADAGVAVVSQPAFLRVPAVAYLPPLAPLRVLAHRTLLDAGVTVAGSSDAPVAPMAPMVGIQDAVARRLADGPRVDAAEAVDALEALAMYTRHAAAACGCADQCGTLEPGKRADLVLLSADPFQPGGPLPASVRVVETVLGGATVHRAVP